MKLITSYATFLLSSFCLILFLSSCEKTPLRNCNDCPSPFVKIYDELSSHNLQRTIQTSNKELIMAGGTSELANSGFILKVDLAGNIEWTQKHKAGITAIAEQQNGNLICAGPDGYVGWDSDMMYLLSVNSKGDELWSKSVDLFSGDQYYTPKSIVSLDAGGFVVSAVLEYDDQNRLSFLAKYDAAGEEVWNKTWDDFLPNKIINQGSNLILVGAFMDSLSSFSTTKPHIVKLDDDGEVIWHKTFGLYSSKGQFHDISIASDQTIICSGTLNNADLSYYTKPFLLKLDLDGNILSENTAADYIASCFVESQNGSIITISKIWDDHIDNHGHKVYFQKYNANGEVVISKFIEGVDIAFPNTLDVFEDGRNEDIIITGTYDCEPQECEHLVPFIIRIDKDGNF